jgi:hypothetical protein
MPRSSIFSVVNRSSISWSRSTTITSASSKGDALFSPDQSPRKSIKFCQNIAIDRDKKSDNAAIIGNQMKTNEENYLKNLARAKTLAQTNLNMTWTKYRATKRAFWELIRDPNYLSGRGKGNVALLVIWLVAVYCLDLLFSWNVAEFVAKQAFHGILWAMYLATFLFPLAYVTIEIVVNDQTSIAKANADHFDRDRGKRLTWLAWLTLSLLLAMVMPIAYIATGLAGMANNGNSVFIWLLGGLTLLAFLVHVMLIFSGDNMLAAKQRFFIMLGHNWRHRKMQKSYHGLMRSLGSLQSLEQDYQSISADIGRFLPPEPPAPLVSYVLIYITQDYHHLPFGEEPPLTAIGAGPARLLGSGSN